MWCWSSSLVKGRRRTFTEIKKAVRSHPSLVLSKLRQWRKWWWEGKSLSTYVSVQGSESNVLYGCQLEKRAAFTLEYSVQWSTRCRDPCDPCLELSLVSQVALGTHCWKPSRDVKEFCGFLRCLMLTWISAVSFSRGNDSRGRVCGLPLHILLIVFCS